MAVTSSKPKAGWSWTRYVDSGQGFRRGRSSGRSSVDTAEDDQRSGTDVDLLALLHRLALAEAGLPADGGRPAGGLGQRQVVGIEHHDPVVAPVAVRRDGEGQLLVVGVEQHQEAVVGDLLAPGIG